MGIINEEGKILGDERVIYKPPLGKRIIPTECAEHHKRFANNVLKKALYKARLSLKDITILSYSCGPGLPPCLLVGANLACNLSKKYKKPLIPVNHMLSHVEIGRLLTNCRDPVITYLSGGNTMIITFVEGKYRVMGETQDLAVGNALDMVATEMELPHPGGPEIEKLAHGGRYIELPYVVKGCDLSYSGIVTAAINLLKRGISKKDIAYSLMECCFAMLVEVTERALAHTNKEEVLLVGGVAANKRLQGMMELMCRERGAQFHAVSPEYSGDNGVMIAWCGILHYKHGCVIKVKDKILPNYRIDKVPICWIK